MARMVRHELTGPVRIDPQEKPVFVCGCGLTQNFPMCDGSHKTCVSEKEGTLYVYDAKRQSVVEEKPDAG